MKKELVVLCVCFVLPLFIEGIFSQKNLRQEVLATKSDLGGYETLSYAEEDIVFLPVKAQKKIMEFTVFAGRKYKLVISESGISGFLPLTIYDKPAAAKNRRQVFSNSAFAEKEFCSFEPGREGTYYLEFDIPACVSASGKKGKIIILIGVKDL